MPKWIAICSAAMLLPCLNGCGTKTAPTEKSPATKQDEPEHSAHSHKGSHGGDLITVGSEKAHVEIVHHAVEGKADLYITGPDGKSELVLEKAPELKLITEEGPKVVKTESTGKSGAKASQFTATDEALKKDPLKGFIAIEIDGAPYNPALPEEHHHSH